jgi:TetR/AcrR family transcriptional repressor of nem operon
MRQSREHKEQTHRHIVATAARMLREKGVEATGLVPVMKAAGLTHGGFYRHFDSKDALGEAAIRAAFDEFLGPIESEPDPKRRAAQTEGYLSLYLSDVHVANPGRGCPIAALSHDASRMTGPTRKAFEDGVARTIALLDARAIEKAPPGYSGSKALTVLVGAVSLARSADPETGARILQDARATLRTGPLPQV